MVGFSHGRGKSTDQGKFILGRGVLLSPSNPDPVLKPIVHFDTLIHFILQKKLRVFFLN